MESIFKALSREYNAVKDSQDENLQDKKELLSELINYVNSMKWLSRTPAKKKITFFIKCGYDYEAFCAEFNISYESAKNSVKWAAKQLKSKIGEHTVRLIRDGYIEEARLAFYTGSGQISRETLFLSDMVAILPESKFSAAYDLQDCLTELVYLRKISLDYIEKHAKKVDKHKLAYLLSLIEGSSRKATWLRPYIIDMLMGYMKIKDLLLVEEKIKEENYIY